MNRRFRLTRSTDFQRVRRTGKSYAHPLVVLIALPNQAQETRMGIVAGRSVGGAVVRNKSKRRLRSILHTLLPLIRPGWDLVFIARKPISECDFITVEQAVKALLSRVGILHDEMV